MDGFSRILDQVICDFVQGYVAIIAWKKIMVVYCFIMLKIDSPNSCTYMVFNLELFF